jgi:hypothetical protein
MVTVPEKPSLLRRIEREIRRFRKRLAAPSLQHLDDRLQRFEHQLQRLDHQIQLAVSEAIAQKLNELRSDLKAEVLAELSFSFHDQEELLADLKTRLDEISNHKVETKNRAAPINSSVHNRLNTVGNLKHGHPPNGSTSTGNP